jgi:nucleoside recognition membrane protein YjiH
MTLGILKDASNDNSSTRLYELLIVATIIIISFISVFTGKDIGLNTANMLQWIGGLSIIGFEGKKAVEYYSEKKVKNDDITTTNL